MLCMIIESEYCAEHCAVQFNSFKWVKATTFHC